MQNKFKYIYNGKEVGKEDFYNLCTVDAFKWFEGNSINAIDSSSVFGGEKEDKVIHSTPITPNEEQRQKLENLRKQIAFNESLEGKPFSKILDILNCDMEKYVKNIEVKDPETVTPLKFLRAVENGIKESQTVKKAPVFTYCKQMKNAVEALALRSLYGHERYEKGDDWENFARVPNGEFEYSNSMFRHALEIGGDEDEKEHLIATAWNAVAKLEIYLRKNLHNSK